MTLLAAAFALAAASLGQAPDSSARLIAMAADTSAPIESRVTALRGLRGLCAPATLNALTPLAEPYRQPWVIWHGAMTALSDCAVPAMAPYWRDMVTFPRRPVRELAIVGLARTGVAADRELLGEVMHREDDAHLRRLAAWADTMLGAPSSQRLGPPPAEP